ncbi:DUF4065 domain-containing protein [Enterococcus gallinarum]|uniref:Panacea domain-containing protein n=1 Tax=Enterococcus gallinarum TaxID=1353 RepID=UPI00288FBA52|nr:type II toxin-antitoxin system antitoxin SocA domain-containing protein [Enterococcus gallinarum]MDT2698338.1 DUF4065 domain-containing protein [Enterococcus gallinarum]
MAYHFIAVSSYYKGGTRIGWHYASNTQLDKKIIKQFLDESELQLGKVEFGIHKLITDDCTWDSVVQKDSFFGDVLVHEDKDAFLSLLKEDRDITVIDIAKFFLSVGAVTNLKLQKLIYFAYATYLDKTGESLFPEQIVAFKYGPVVEEVYHLYKEHGRDYIESENGPKFRLKDVSVPVSVAKLALSDSSDKVFEALTETLEKYWHKSASELVSISHVDDSPWSHAYKSKLYNCEITDEMIKKYHIYEKAQL